MKRAVSLALAAASLGAGAAHAEDYALAVSGSIGTTGGSIEGQTFTPAQVGSLQLDAVMEETAPFVGIGFDTTFQGSSNFGFRGVVGAMFTGTATIELQSVGGLLSSDPAFLAEIENEEADLRGDIDNFEVYPVAQLGVSYRF